MGTFCSNCTEEESSRGQLNLISSTRVAEQDLRRFKLDDYQTKFVPASFQHLPSGEKDKLLSEVIRIIIQDGDPDAISTNNKTMQDTLKKSNAKISNGKDVYQGETIEGIANGYGTIRLEGGGLFEGKFVGGLRRGRGVSHFPTGYVVEAVYGINGVAQGLATIRSPAQVTSQMLFLNGVGEGPSFTEYPQDYVFDYLSFDARDGLVIRLKKNLSSLVLQEYRKGSPKTMACFYTRTAPSGFSESRNMAQSAIEAISYHAAKPETVTEGQPTNIEA